jgi:tetratricopeptide (TPR) repeat protein
MRKTNFLLLFLFLYLHAASQLQHHASRNEIDSLQQRLDGKGIKDRIRILNQLAGCYASLSFDTSIRYGKQALHLAETAGGSLDVALVKVNIGNAYYYKMDFRNAVLSYLSATRILDENKKWKESGEIYFQLGNINFYIMRSDKSISYYRKALKYFNLSGDEQSLASVWENIGISIFLISHWPADSSKTYGIKLLNYSRRIHDRYLEAKALMEIAMYYSNDRPVNGVSKAVSYGDSALNLASELKNHELLSIIWSNLGFYYANSQLLTGSKIERELARSCYIKSIHEGEKAGKNILQVLSLNNLTPFDIEEKWFDSAEIRLDSAEAKLNDYFMIDNTGNAESDNSINFREEPFNFFVARQEKNNLYLNRYNLVMARGELRKAIDYLNLYYQSRDSMNAIQQGRQLDLLIAEAEAERTDQKIKGLAQDNELANIKLSRSRFIFIGAGAGIVIIGLFLLLYFQRKRWNAEQKSVTLEQKLLRSQMNPHFIFNSLASIQNFVVNHKANEASIYLSRFSQLIRNILDNSMEEYIPLQKEIETILHYLELQKVRYAGQFTYNLTVDERIDGESMMVPPMLAQPFIENAIEHGIRHKETAGHVDVRFSLERNLIRFEVEDDGIGRERAREIRLKQKQVHRSLSTSIAHDRLNRLNKKLKTKIRLEITDLKNDRGEACGTKVAFGIPVTEK